MLLRIIGLMLVISALVSMAVLVVPSVVDLGYVVSRYYAGDLSVGYDNTHIYLFYVVRSPYISSSVSIYRYVAEVKFSKNPYVVKPHVEIPDNIEISTYLVQPARLTAPIPGSTIFSKPRTQSLLAELGQKSAAKGGEVVLIPPNTAVYNHDLVVVVRIPVDGFKVELNAPGLHQVVDGRTYTNYLEKYLAGTARTPSGYTLNYMDLLFPLQNAFSLEVKFSSRISADALVYLRALSLAILGLLVIAVDAGRHPEWYEGRWSVFRRLAERLGIARSRSERRE